MNKPKTKTVSAVVGEKQMQMIEHIKRETGLMTVSMVIANAILCYYNELNQKRNGKKN